MLNNGANQSIVYADNRIGNKARMQFAQTNVARDMLTHDDRNFWNNKLVDGNLPFAFNLPSKQPISAYRTEMNAQRNLGTIFNGQQLADINAFKVTPIASVQHEKASNIFLNRYSDYLNVLQLQNAKNFPTSFPNVQGVQTYDGPSPPVAGGAVGITKIDLRNGNVIRS